MNKFGKYILSLFGLDAEMEKAIKSANEETHKSRAALQQERQNNASQLDSLKKEMDDLRQQLKDKDESYSSLSSENRQREKEIATLRKAAEDAQSKANQIQLQRQAEERVSNELKQRLDENERTIQRFQKIEELLKLLDDASTNQENPKGPGRPRMGRLPFNLQIDKELKLIIPLLEETRLIRKGEVTTRLNDELRRWLLPLYGELTKIVGKNS